MNLAAIIEALKQLVGGFSSFGDATKWSVLSVQYDGKSVPGTITAFAASATSIEATVRFNGSDNNPLDVTIKAAHHSPQKAKVLVNGTLDEDAALVFAWKGGPPNPSRWAFDFKRVTVDGEDYRINLRFDP